MKKFVLCAPGLNFRGRMGKSGAVKTLYYAICPRKSQRAAACAVGLFAASSLASVGCSGEALLGTVVSEDDAPSDTMGGASGELLGSCQLSNEISNDEIIEIGTFWTKEPDSIAMDVLTDRVSNELGASRTGVFGFNNREDLLNRLRSQMVHVFQVNGGADILQFELDKSLPAVCPLDKMYDELDVRENYFRAAWEPMKCKGSHYSFPLNIHRLNTVMVNRSVYEDLQSAAEDAEDEVPNFEELTSISELVGVLEKVGDLNLKTSEGAPVVPLSLCLGRSAGGVWPLTIVAFENVLASFQAEKAYESIWMGTGDLSSQEKSELIDAMLVELDRLKAVSHLAPEFDSLCGLDESDVNTWQQAAELVRTGAALLTIGGDWLRAQIPIDERDAIKSYAFPGLEDTFVYTPDTFAAQYRPTETGAAARVWFTEVLNHEETQLAFAREKQAIPARSDLGEQVRALDDGDASDLDNPDEDYLLVTYEKFRDCHATGTSCRLLLATSGLSGAGTDVCFDHLGRILAGSIGIFYDESEWDEHFTAECGEIPTTKDEARAALTELLLEVSEAPFAAECRE